MNQSCHEYLSGATYISGLIDSSQTRACSSRGNSRFLQTHLDHQLLANLNLELSRFADPVSNWCRHKLANKRIFISSVLTSLALLSATLIPSLAMFLLHLIPSSASSEQDRLIFRCYLSQISCRLLILLSSNLEIRASQKLKFWKLCCCWFKKHTWTSSWNFTVDMAPR